MLWVVGAIFALLAGLLTLYAVSSRSGTEFCPETFAMRSFNYNKMPLTGWVMSGIQYSDHSSFVGRTLVADKWIVEIPEKRWDLVTESKPFSPAIVSDDCDARFLVNVLSEYEFDKATTSSNNRWLTWSNKHDACAQVLWPLIAKLARMDMYLAIPELMEFARHQAVQDDDPNADKEVIKTEVAKFTAELNRRTAESLFRFAQADEANGKKTRALRRYTLAAKIDNHPQAIASRDRLASEGVSDTNTDNP